MGIALTAMPVCADQAAIEALREGSLEKLMLSEPAAAGAAEFSDAEGGTHALADYAGKVVLVNFWATWCAPCRKEMPGLDALQAEFGGDDFVVLPIATGRNELPGIRRFFEETGVTSLPILLDPKMALSREMGVMALPVTVILNREGQEIGRLMGDADWSSDSAKKIIAALIAAPAKS
ncbi:MAG: TlpA disulfide reductase family protein [Deltaproteobacteria bacterium]